MTCAIANQCAHTQILHRNLLFFPQNTKGELSSHWAGTECRQDKMSGNV